MQLLEQIDSLHGRLRAEEAKVAKLSEENERLSADVRSLAQQLKQERAAGNAVLKQTMHGASNGDAAESADLHETNLATNGLTLASAASQILMLRREVKFLQKQWNSTRRDVEGAARREQVQQLQEDAAEAKRAAAEAEERARGAMARQRTLLRELGSARARLAALHHRIERRTSAQLEAAALRSQLHRVQEQLLHAQQQLKQRLLREELASARVDGQRGEETASEARVVAGAESLVAQLVFSAELGSLEQASQESSVELVALKAVKPDIALKQLQQAEEDRVRLTTELAKALERLAVLQEEKQMLRTSGVDETGGDIKRKTESFAVKFKNLGNRK